jgi:hypothetical protein
LGRSAWWDSRARSTGAAASVLDCVTAVRLSALTANAHQLDVTLHFENLLLPKGIRIARQYAS